MENTTNTPNGISKSDSLTEQEYLEYKRKSEFSNVVAATSQQIEQAKKMNGCEGTSIDVVTIKVVAPEKYNSKEGLQELESRKDPLYTSEAVELNANGVVTVVKDGQTQIPSAVKPDKSLESSEKQREIQRTAEEKYQMNNNQADVSEETRG